MAYFDQTFYEKDTDSYKEDLARRNGGLTAGRDDDQIKQYLDLIKANRLSDDEVELLIHRNPRSAGAFSVAKQNRDAFKKLNDISARNMLSANPAFTEEGPMRNEADRLEIPATPASFNLQGATRQAVQQGVYSPEVKQQFDALASTFQQPTQQIKKSDLVAIETPEGPRYVTAPQALNKTPLTRKGITLRTAGGDVIEIGGDQRGVLDKKVARDQQDKLITAAETVNRLDRIKQIARPEYFTFKSEISATIDRNLSKLGFNLDKEDLANLQGRRRMVNAIEQEFNRYRKEITGAAAALAELNVLRKSFLNSDLSWPEFQASFQEYRDKQIKALEIAQELIKSGIPLGSKEFTQAHNERWDNAADIDNAVATPRTVEDIDAEIADLERQLRELSGN